MVVPENNYLQGTRAGSCISPSFGVGQPIYFVGPLCTAVRFNFCAMCSGSSFVLEKTNHLST